MGMQGSFVDFFESRGYYVHILVTENKMMSVTNLHQLSKYKEEVIWVVKWSEGHVKIGVQYLWSNDIRN